MKMDDKKLVSFEGVLRLLEEKKGWRQKVEVKLLNSKVNRNNWQYLNLEQHKHLFAETPLLVAYKGKQIGDGHNYDEVYAPDGTVYASFMSATSERIVGWFKADSDIRIETIDDTEWVIGIGYIWTWYAQELVAKLNGQGGGLSEMPVSIETLIDEMHMDGDTEVFTKYQILGTTILGDSVAPAVADASIRVLAAIGAEGIHDMTLRVASANPQTENDENGDDPSNTPVGSASANPVTNTQVKAKGQKPYYMKGKIGMNRIKELSAKFEGLSVLACNADMALLADENGTYTSAYKVNDGEITVDEKVAVDASVSVGDGDDAVVFALSEIRANDVAKIADLEAKVSALEEEKKVALENLATMKTKEHERRINAVKAVIVARINELKEAGINADEAECQKLLEDASLEKFAEMEEEGEFCGEEKACSAVDAIGAKAVLAQRKAEKAARANRYAWDIGAKGNNEPSSYIESVLANNAN